MTGNSNPVIGRCDTRRHNRYLVDGLDIADRVEGTFSATSTSTPSVRWTYCYWRSMRNFAPFGGVINLMTKERERQAVGGRQRVPQPPGAVAGWTGRNAALRGRLLDQADQRSPVASVNQHPVDRSLSRNCGSTDGYRYRPNSVIPGCAAEHTAPPAAGTTRPVYAGSYPGADVVAISRHRLNLSIEIPTQRG